MFFVLRAPLDRCSANYHPLESGHHLERHRLIIWRCHPQRSARRNVRVPPLPSSELTDNMLSSTKTSPRGINQQVFIDADADSIEVNPGNKPHHSPAALSAVPGNSAGVHRAATPDHRRCCTHQTGQHQISGCWRCSTEPWGVDEVSPRTQIHPSGGQLEQICLGRQFNPFVNE